MANAPSPLVASSLTHLLETFQTAKLIEAWQTSFNIDISEYITEIQTPPLPTSVTSAVPNPQVITQGQNLAAGNLQANQQTGLTPLEEVLLTDEEKLIRQRQRGITT